jgi:hypothetical protein
MSVFGSVLGGVLDSVSAVKRARDSEHIANQERKAGIAGNEAGGGLAKALASWSGTDYDTATKMFEPSNQALVDRVNKTPDYAHLEGAAVSPLTQNTSQQMASARTAGQVSDAAANGSATGGLARASSRFDADTGAFKDRAGVVGTFAGNPGVAARAVAGQMGTDFGTANKFGNAASGQMRETSQAYGDAGNAIGGLAGQGMTFLNGLGPTTAADGNTYASAGDYNAIPQWKDGGLVIGPGTGRSDSVLALVDGSQPAKVSNGEYVIPAAKAQRIGVGRLKKIIAMHSVMSGAENKGNWT